MIVHLRGESLNWLVKQWPQYFYTQTWYLAEPFAQRPYKGQYELGIEPQPAVVLAKAFVDSALAGTILWGDSYHWTSDVDHNQDRVYVGRSVEYGGLQIHRHLTPQIED